jgi:hypothetical protein
MCCSEELEATQNEVKDQVRRECGQGFDHADHRSAAGFAERKSSRRWSPPSIADAGAKLLRQPGIVEFLAAKLEALPEKLRDDPAVEALPGEAGRVEGRRELQPGQTAEQS